MLCPLCIAGIGLMLRARIAGSSTSVWLDGVVSAFGLISLSATLVFPRVTQGATGSTAAIVTNFAYPSLDLALVATVIGAMAVLAAWRDPVWLLLVTGFLTFAAADSAYLLQLAAGTTTRAAWSTPLTT